MGCVVKTCNSRSEWGVEDRGISFHKFPKQKVTSDLWAKQIGGPHWQPHKTSRICSLHFTDDCFFKVHNRTQLRPGSIPTLHLATSLEENDLQMSIASSAAIIEPILVTAEYSTDPDIPVSVNSWEMATTEQMESLLSTSPSKTNLKRNLEDEDCGSEQIAPGDDGKLPQLYRRKVIYNIAAFQSTTAARTRGLPAFFVRQSKCQNP